MGERGAERIEVARRLLARLPDGDVRAAFLYGSSAVGEADETSDLDLVLLLDGAEGADGAERLRVADLVPAAPGVPRFADVDRVAADRYAEQARRGEHVSQLRHLVVLRDRAGFLGELRRRALAEHDSPAARARRFHAWRRYPDAMLATHADAARAGDRVLAALCARLAVDAAVARLTDLVGEHASAAHFVGTLGRTLAAAGVPDRRRKVLRALVGRPSGMSVTRSRAAVGELFGWVRAAVDDARVRAGADGAMLRRAAFVCSVAVEEEIDAKVAAAARRRRLASPQYYLDAKLLGPGAVSAAVLLRARRGEPPGGVTPTDFLALARRDEPGLAERWSGALRLDAAPRSSTRAAELARGLLALGAGIAALD